MRRRGIVMAAVLAVTAALWVAPAGAAVTRTQGGGAQRPRLVPYQFVAKAYTELLGRAPDPAGWRAAVAFFSRAGCSPATLEAFGERMIGGAEYRADYPDTPADAPAIVLTLYRFVLDREPDAAGFVLNRDLLQSGRLDPGEEAANLFASAEFRQVTEPAICNRDNPDYGSGEPGHPDAFLAIQTPSTGTPGPLSAEPLLQYLLDRRAAAGGGTVALPPRMVVGLRTTLVVPGNVTLVTAGLPGPNRYADMARLVRVRFFVPARQPWDDEIVQLDPGARLESVWVDGQRQAAVPNDFVEFDLRTLGGSGTTVRDDRISSPVGASDLEVDGGQSGVPGARPCAGNEVADNLFDGYGTSHLVPAGPGAGHVEADAIGVYCTHTTVVGNDIVDVSDTGVALFDGASYLVRAAPQESVVADNTIVSAGNSYSFGIVTDPAYSLDAPTVAGGDPPGRVSRDFSGTLIIDNTLWSGARTHFDVVLSAGSHDLFGSDDHQNCLLPNPDTGLATCGGGRNARGPVFYGNGDDGLGIEVQMGVYVGGTAGTVMWDNQFHLVEVAGGTCPKAAAVVATGPGGSTFAPGLRIDVPVWHDRSLRSDSCVTPVF